MIREMIRQVVTAALIGAVATVGHYATLVLLVEILSVNAVAASLTGFVVGGLIGYPLNRRVTFRSDRSHAVAAPSFFAIAGVAFALDGVLMAFLIEALGRVPGLSVLVHGRDYLVAQVLTTLILFTWTFSANRFWTFRRTAAGNRAAAATPEGVAHGPAGRPVEAAVPGS